MELKPLQLNPPLNLTVIKDVTGLEELSHFFQNNKILGWDKETNPTRDFYWRRCRLNQFGTVEKQYVIDLLGLCNGDSELLFKAQGEYGKNLALAPALVKMVEVTRPVLESDQWLKIGVNLGFEYMTAYWNFGIRPFNFWDCTLVEKCIYAGAHSLKHYEFFDMENMTARYFGVKIDKTYQTSFTLDNELSVPQYEYAALDTRLPFALKAAQTIIVKGYTRQTNNAAFLATVDPVILGDNLEEVCKIENDAIGAFQDMHVHGEKINCEGWNGWLDEKRNRFKQVMEELDKTFIPKVGRKTDIITQEQIDQAELNWRSLRDVSLAELELRKLARKDPEAKLKLNILESERKIRKEEFKKEAAELRRKRKEQLDIVEGAEGDALINYSSSDQLLEVLKTFKELRHIKSTGDEVLEQYNHIPVVKLLQEFREIDKIFSTYGTAWTTRWTTHPCKEEGWLHPGDGRIHHVYNQMEADTGRSSSESPNGQNVPPDPRKFYEAEEGQVCVTADMSGAELRILAEEADDPIWIDAYSRGEDLHSVGAEILFPTEWFKLQLPDCNYFHKKPNGDPQRKQCECPDHKKLRKKNKSNNFLIVYGGGPGKLSKELKVSFGEAKELMAIHESKFPKIWGYLDKSGKDGRLLQRSFDMFGRRRLFPKPTNEQAVEKAKETFKKKLEYSKEIKKRNRDNFIKKYNRKPNKDEAWYLNHRMPTGNEIINCKQALAWGIERQAKNHRMQGGNASIAKIAMAMLWHKLPNYKATLKKFVHDELVVMCPPEHGDAIAALIGECFKNAAALRMKKVVMLFDFKIAKYWIK